MNTIESALEQYRKTFGENYPFLVVDIRSDEEIIEEIIECIRTGEKAKKPEYKKGAVY